LGLVSKKPVPMAAEEWRLFPSCLAFSRSALRIKYPVT
jgi:hypothetical protein